jgi:hypothetical protein
MAMNDERSHKHNHKHGRKCHANTHCQRDSGAGIVDGASRLGNPDGAPEERANNLLLSSHAPCGLCHNRNFVVTGRQGAAQNRLGGVFMRPTIPSHGQDFLAKLELDVCTGMDNWKIVSIDGK